MIKRLTPEQTAIIPSILKEWLEIGLATGDCDLPAAKACATEAYQQAGLPAPSLWLVADSPLSGAVMAAYPIQDQVRGQVRAQVWAQVRAQVGAQVGDQVWEQAWAQIGDQVRDQVWGQVRAQVRDQVRDQVWTQVRDQVGAPVWAQVWAQARAQVGTQVGDQVWDQVGAQVGDQVWDQVKDQVWDQVKDQVWGRVRAQVRDQVGVQVGGCYDAAWLSICAFFGEVGLDVEQLRPLMNLARYTGFWAPYRDVCIFQHKPDFILFDDRRLLHCATGPAIQYRDGLSVYAWHGTRIPSQWITQGVDSHTALTHNNLEQRRAACEILGWAAILEDLNARTIDRHPNPQIGELLEVELPDVGRERFLKVQCGTGRTFALPVPPSCATAHEANAWTYGRNTSDYQPEVRT